MEKTKLLTCAVIALLVLNFGVLGFLFFSKEKERPNGRPMPKEVVIEKLGFDKNQVQVYDKLIRGHRDSIRAIDDAICNTKNKLYQLLNNETIAYQKDSLISKIAMHQVQIEKINFNHFNDIKKICNKEQVEKFEDLTLELTHIFSKKPKIRHD